MKIYLSHLGEPAFQAVNELDTDELCLGDILRDIEKRLPGTLAILCTGTAAAPKLKPHVAAYKNVQCTDGQIYDSDRTEELKNAHMDEPLLEETQNLLISVFDPERFGRRFVDLMQDGNVPELKCTDENGKEYRDKDFRTYFSNVQGPICENIYRFRDGEVTLGQLLTDGAVEFVRNAQPTDSFTVFDRPQSRVLPKQLVNALVDLWDLPNAQARLRRFQEDSLFYILGKLRDHTAYHGDALLLSIPTGGGKTEAFTIPLIAHVVDEKQHGLADARVRAVITYPTKALANDQARRLVEIIHRVNQEIIDPSQKVTIGVLTGDTPRDYRKKGSLIVQCPACGQAALDYVADPSVPKVKKVGVCKACQARMDYFRVTRQDILESPPDILITNPDMINYCLQDTLYGTLFRKPIDVMVFDEVHLCDGIFGCNVAHLLRRLEEASNHKPLYVGISATIQNAKALASLIFDVPEPGVEYLHHRERFIDEGIVERYRYHFSVVPHQYSTGKRVRYMRVLTAVLNLVDMLGHSVRDPHFRKTLVFANFRQDADHIAQYLLDQEDHFYARYHDTVFAKLKATGQLDGTEVRIAQQVGHWYNTIEADGHLHPAKLEVGWHRGGLEQEERIRAINRFVLTRPVQVDEYGDPETPVDATIATKTLELGIDIGDVTTVINSSAPHTKNEYVQRVGRGGRRKSALAVTVIDPGYPLDYYFHERFEDMITKPGGFEDAPIIVSNRSIRRSHLLGRILDLWASEIVTKTGQLSVKAVRDWRLKDHNFQEIGLDSPLLYADALVDQLLLQPITLPGGGTMTRLERLNAWFAKESELLGVEQVSLSVDEVREVFREKIDEFSRKTNPQTQIYKDADGVNGYKAVDRDFTPAMRGVGTLVDLWVLKGDDVEKTDAVGRTRAVSSMPPHAFSTMGANTYEIDSIRELDEKAERRLLTLLMEAEASRTFFRAQFGEPFPTEAEKVAQTITVRVPHKYQVKFRPNRFYCQRCGRTYTKLPFDERCEAPECKAELRQLTQFYQCEKCGELYDPPIPRVCPNPDCVSRHPQFMKEINRPNSKPPYELFKFWALPGLVWRCRECKTTFSYHDPSVFPQYQGQNLYGYLKGIDRGDDNTWSPKTVAKHYLHFPETKSSRREMYEDKGYHRARWKCAKADCGGKLKARNVPVVRSLTEEYIAARRPLADDGHHLEAKLQFNHVTVATLAREYFYRFYDPKNDESRMREPMEIWNPSVFLANVYDTHAAFVKFTEQLDQFVTNHIDCKVDKCEKCPHVEKVIGPESNRPSTEPPDWLRDKDSKEPKSPAPWGEWGSGADEKEFFRFILVHTLKHSLMMALPKYTGVATSEVAGRVYPNNQRENDLTIVDSTEDGSGAILLVRQRWNHIWELSQDMAANALAGKGSLFLEYGCQHYNRNLCPALASWFYRYLETGELPPSVEV